MCSNLFTQSGFDFIFRRCFCLVSENCIGGVMVQVLGCSRTCVRALVGSIQRLIKFVFAASPLHTALINKNKD